MRTEERIRAVRRVIDQGEALLDAWAELGDELSAMRRRSLTRPISPQRGTGLRPPKTVSLRRSRCYGSG